MKDILVEISKKSPSTISSKIPTKTASTFSVMEGLRLLIEEWGKNRRSQEEQKTRREEIKALKDVELSRHKIMREIIQQYFNQRFNERELFLKELSSFLDKETDVEIRIKIIDTMVEIVKKSPLDDFENVKSRFIESKDIEI